jgi:glycosyltransferase involved in cell wall biosynthesis
MVESDTLTIDRPAPRASGGSAAKPLRVLHVINGRFFGGGHRSALLLMQALEQRGNVETELCTLGEGGELPLRGRSRIVIPYDGRYNNPAVLLWTARRLRWVLHEHDPDILHTHGLDADLVGVVAVRGCRARHVSHLRVSPPLGHRESWRAGVRRRLLRHLTRSKGTLFIAVSESVRQKMAEYYRIPLERIVTVRNGVDVHEFGVEGACAGSQTVQAGERPLVIGMAGRLAPSKGFEQGLEAAAALQNRGIPFELRIAGAGRERDALERRAATLGIAEQTRFLGPVQDMSAFYGNLDVFVLASFSEGLPLVLLEAMGVGTSVVASDLDCIREVVEDGVNGLLVPTGDADALAGALARLAGDAELRKKLAEAGGRHVREKFTVERVAAEVAEIYERVVAEGRGSRVKS